MFFAVVCMLFGLANEVAIFYFSGLLVVDRRFRERIFLGLGFWLKEKTGKKWANSCPSTASWLQIEGSDILKLAPLRNWKSIMSCLDYCNDDDMQWASNNAQFTGNNASDIELASRRLWGSWKAGDKAIKGIAPIETS
ncbi:uncharacterized protein LOC131316794 [Rhododendron vialii]|uniref:uncharacterized protein LOC131316794 n=1 Tax=Rhododendron vialii TaxID=182163 RepID=UPI00265D8BB9|nr:uncharacterized protein LOC131316794 [Rhododendron vialii]